MTVSEYIEKLKHLPGNAEVMVEIVNDSCDLCSHAKTEKCSLAGTYHAFAEEPYLHEASNEARIRSY